MSKLQSELDIATNDGRLSRPTVAYADASKLPYLNAVIKESLRLFSPVALSLPRHVPAGGAIIAGEFIPAGTTVGINAAVIHKDARIFGSDPDTFNPDRWLGGGDATADAKRMEQYMFHFGGGTRVCLGKNVSICELYKLIPQLFRDFELELVDPEMQWRTWNSMFNKQKGVVVSIRRREVHN